VRTNVGCCGATAELLDRRLHGGRAVLRRQHDSRVLSELFADLVGVLGGRGLRYERAACGAEGQRVGERAAPRLPFGRKRRAERAPLEL
jgi:hypothetical protein